MVLMKSFEELLKKHKERIDQQYQYVLNDFADLSGSIKYLNIEAKNMQYSLIVKKNLIGRHMIILMK